MIPVALFILSPVIALICISSLVHIVRKSRRPRGGNSLIAQELRNAGWKYEKAYRQGCMKRVFWRAPESAGLVGSQIFIQGEAVKIVRGNAAAARRAQKAL